MRGERHTSGFPLRPLSQCGEMTPVHVPPSRPNQCRHGMSASWETQCEADGTWRFPDYMADQHASQSERDWVEGARFCTEHAPPGAVKVAP